MLFEMFNLKESLYTGCEMKTLIEYLSLKTSKVMTWNDRMKTDLVVTSCHSDSIYIIQRKSQTANEKYVELFLYNHTRQTPNKRVHANGKTLYNANTKLLNSTMQISFNPTAKYNAKTPYMAMT